MPESGRSNPAIAFLRTRRDVTADELVEHYASFLLHEASAYQLPVQLDRVREHFALPVRHLTLAADQRGFTTDDLRIYLNADDWPTVQKFTLAHEFMEVLFFALKDGYADEWMSDEVFTTLLDHKERFCDKGAAELVMPLPLFADLVAKQPMSFQRAQGIAAHCEVSLTAALWRMIEVDLVPMVYVIWRHTNSPTEFVPSQVGQGNLFGPPEAMDPPKKMRVHRVFAPPGTPFIPVAKSAPIESSIHRAFAEDSATSGMEALDLVGVRGRYLVESRPFTADGERRVMSLIHLDATG